MWLVLQVGVIFFSHIHHSHTYYHINMLTKPTAVERKAELEAKHAERERKLVEERAAEEALACEIEQQEEQERQEEEER